jgi:hypothetical protein
MERVRAPICGARTNSLSTREPLLVSAPHLEQPDPDARAQGRFQRVVSLAFLFAARHHISGLIEQFRVALFGAQPC